MTPRPWPLSADLCAVPRRANAWSAWNRLRLSFVALLRSQEGSSPCLATCMLVVPQACDVQPTQSLLGRDCAFLVLRQNSSETPLVPAVAWCLIDIWARIRCSPAAVRGGAAAAGTPWK
eukprot:scaffold324_cov394-Prasinococcus_capsulatus_cf.AAC.29